MDRLGSLAGLMLSNSLTMQSSHQIRHISGSLSPENSRAPVPNDRLVSPGVHAIFRILQGLSESREAGATYWLGLQEKDGAGPPTPLLIL